jgi:hypothetical protein
VNGITCLLLAERLGILLPTDIRSIIIDTEVFSFMALDTHNRMFWLSFGRVLVARAEATEATCPSTVLRPP